MDLNEIKLNQLENEELLEVYNTVKGTIEYLKNEININGEENN